MNFILGIALLTLGIALSCFLILFSYLRLKNKLTRGFWRLIIFSNFWTGLPLRKTYTVFALVMGIIALIAFLKLAIEIIIAK